MRDYLIKPFASRELLARVEGATRAAASPDADATGTRATIAEDTSTCLNVDASSRMGAERQRLAMRASVMAQLLERIRAEFLEMPGLRLTREQVQRLCGVEDTICQDLLDTLVDAKFLCAKPGGAYARMTDGADVRAPQPTKAALKPESAMRMGPNIAIDGRRGVR